MILQYCEGGDFAAYLKEHKRLSENTAKHFLRQLGNILTVVVTYPHTFEPQLQGSNSCIPKTLFTEI